MAFCIIKKSASPINYLISTIFNLSHSTSFFQLLVTYFIKPTPYVLPHTTKLFFFGLAQGMWKFPGQGTNLCQSSNPSCCNQILNPLCYNGNSLFSILCNYLYKMGIIWCSNIWRDSKLDKFTNLEFFYLPCEFFPFKMQPLFYRLFCLVLIFNIYFSLDNIYLVNAVPLFKVQIFWVLNFKMFYMHNNYIFKNSIWILKSKPPLL